MEVKLAITTDGELLVSPTDMSEDLQNDQVWAEFIINSEIDSKATLIVTTEPTIYEYTFPEDGLFTYYKLRIYKDTALTEQDKEGRIYYNTQKNCLMYNKQILDYKEIYDIIRHTGVVLDYIEKPVFSIYFLSVCTSDLQRELIYGRFRKGTIETCDSYSDKKKIRDFLTITIFVLRELIHQQRFAECLDILKTIKSCVSLCDDHHVKQNSCGCNNH